MTCQKLITFVDMRIWDLYLTYEKPKTYFHGMPTTLFATDFVSRLLVPYWIRIEKVKVFQWEKKTERKAKTGRKKDEVAWSVVSSWQPTAVSKMMINEWELVCLCVLKGEGKRYKVLHDTCVLRDLSWNNNSESDWLYGFLLNLFFFSCWCVGCIECGLIVLFVFSF